MVKLGIDRLQADDFALLKNKRVGLMTNGATADSRLNSTYDVFRQAAGVNLTALFAPEHGFAGAVADGEKVDTLTDMQTGLPIYSLYGESLRPTQQMLDGIDVMVCDIQDIGVRFYTFLWTISYIMEACGEYGVEVMILDRPNPLGDRVRGGGLAPELSSFVGRFPIPIQHGMTLGEVSRMVNDLWNPTPATVTVVPCADWSRHTVWDETGLPYIAPSPNMPHFISNLHYPGSCLVEGTTLSEGRGTALPFEVVGAPYMDGIDLAERLNSHEWAGVRFRPHTFLPSASKYAGIYCNGVQAHITDRQQYDPLLVWLGVISEIRHMYPDGFSWLPRYDKLQHFDRLIGDVTVRQKIDAGVAISEIAAAWPAFEDEFRKLRAAYIGV